MAIDEIPDGLGNLAGLQIAAAAQLLGDGVGDIARPACGRVEGDDANGTAVLAVQQIRDYGFETGGFGAGLAPRLTDPAAEVVEHKINVLVIARWHDRGDRSDLGINQLPAPTGFKPMAVESFPAASPDTKKKRPRHGLTSSF